MIPPTAADDEMAPPRPNRRRLYWGIGILAVLFVGAVSVVTYTDAEAPDLSDLAFERVPVPDDENLYLALIKRGDVLKASPVISAEEPDDTVPVPIAGQAVEPISNGSEAAPSEIFGNGADPRERTLRERLLDGEDWTPARLVKWGGALDQLAVECREIARLPKAQGSVPQSPAEIVPVGSIRELMQQLRLAVWAQFKSGRQTEAVETALLGLDIGRRLADARGSLVDYLTAIAIQGIFQEVLQDMAAHPEMERAVLGTMLDALKIRPGGTDAYADSLRNEARSTVRLIHSLTASEMAKHGISGGGPTVVIAKTRVLYPLIYKPNLTVALYAGHMRQQLRIYDLPIEERRMRNPKLVDEDLDLLDLDVRAFLKPYNVLGRAFLAMVMPTFQSLDLTRHLAFSRQSLLTAFVALRLHYLERGVLPATLDELVPAYLPEVPMDYVDRQPIRYSREARMVWSTGRKNLHVTAADQEIDEREVFYRLDFAAPPVEATKPAGASAPAAP